ncbi:MAG: penicillin-binding protein 1C [Bacteroidetes bacterium]|nr:MAG: penicillin-binding protein 1C [Bacteroidota bacterium]
MLQKGWNFLFVRHRRASLFALAILSVWYYFSLPDPLFSAPFSRVLLDRNGQLLGATIAEDEQWRFPPSADVPEKFAAALIEFEDRRFWHHPGVDPIGIGRAMIQNIKNGRVVSGGSTLTMQVIRLSGEQKSRTVARKIIETILATRLELAFSKKEILSLYAAYAPFGGNVVGLEAAAWRYFGKKPNLLSWAEAATLAVLPNSPGLIHPGRNREALHAKRDRLLKRLYEKGAFDELTYQTALDEPLPERPHPLPRLAPHLIYQAFGGSKTPARIQTTLDANLQLRVTQTLEFHNKILKGNGIHNLAALILDVETGEVLAYVGNVLGTGREHGEEVDVIKAPRSTGSILKPFLYALMIDEGELIPPSLVPDIPTYLSGYRPVNFNESFDGVVPARQALIRSLNVPFVRMLQNYGLEKFHFNLKKWGFYSLKRPPQEYGLPLIVGGGEASLWEIAAAYASFARTLNHFAVYDGQYDPADFHAPTYVLNQKAPKSKKKTTDQPPAISATAIWHTFETMRQLERPNESGEWEKFEGSQKIAWKTGTSFGFRDAWACGVNARYVVGVWAGNADGEGRPGLIGIRAAAPVLFDLFDLLPAGDWFEPPLDEMVPIEICRESGYKALPICEKDTFWTTPQGENLRACPFHKLIHLDSTEKWQVRSDCESPLRMHQKPWFVLPPIEAAFFQSKSPTWQPLPPFRPDCRAAADSENPMQLIYPRPNAKIYIPKNLDGSLSRTVFKAAHRDPEAVIFWHLDQEYIGQTTHFHDFELIPTPGRHVITLVDGAGNRRSLSFEIIEKT